MSCEVGQNRSLTTFLLSNSILEYYNMPTQLELPTEILLSIFRYLDDLDDVFHLARSCRRLHDVLEGSGNRLHVFRSVIVCDGAKIANLTLLILA